MPSGRGIVTGDFGIFNRAMSETWIEMGVRRKRIVLVTVTAFIMGLFLALCLFTPTTTTDYVAGKRYNSLFTPSNTLVHTINDLYNIKYIPYCFKCVVPFLSTFRVMRGILFVFDL